MSDLFHEKIPVEFVLKVFNMMKEARHHTFQVLTKRADRLAEIAGQLPWPDNVWMGVSVENQDYVDRIDYLRTTPAFIKFLSLEPLLGPLDHLNLDGIDWTIAGGESGPNARPMNPNWVRSIRDQCNSAGVAFHFKQWGGVQKKQTGRTLDGRTWDELPITKSCRPGIVSIPGLVLSTIRQTTMAAIRPPLGFDARQISHMSIETDRKAAIRATHLSP